MSLKKWKTFIKGESYDVDSELNKIDEEIGRERGEWKEEEDAPMDEDYIEKLLEEVKELLGDGAIFSNNSIKWRGKVIEYYSETNSFAINGTPYLKIKGRKTTLTTPEDVVEYLGSDILNEKIKIKKRNDR